MVSALFLWDSPCVNFLCVFVSFQMVTKTKKVFIGGLSSNTNEDDMRTHFEEFGTVRENVLLFPHNNLVGFILSL